MNPQIDQIIAPHIIQRLQKSLNTLNKLLKILEEENRAIKDTSEIIDPDWYIDRYDLGSGIMTVKKEMR